MKLRRFLSCMMALLLVCSLPVSALAAEYDLAKGSITVSADESGQYVTQADNEIINHPETSDTVITQSNSSETSTSNTVTITAGENATANVTLKDVNIVISDLGYTEDVSGKAAVTIDVADNASANVTLDGVDIDLSETGSTSEWSGEAAVQITGKGDVTMELDGENTVQSGAWRAGVEKDDANSTGNLTITDENGTAGSLNATGGDWSAGIGGGISGQGFGGTGTQSGNASNITITGSAEVIATGGSGGSGIGGGASGTGSNITVSGDAQVKAQGGEGAGDNGAGAAIGDGGVYSNPAPGREETPATDKLTPNGKIEYYAPGANMETDAPIDIVTGTYVPPQDEEKPPVDEEDPDQPPQPLYRVVGQDGKALACKEVRSSGVLTITVDADFATLTGNISGLKTLKAQGVDTIVFETNGATSTFAISDLLAQGGDSYKLTHDGESVTFTLGNGTDISKILK